MKIAYIINSIECGGAQLPIPDIVDVMRKKGATVTVFGLAAKDALAAPCMEKAGIAVRVRKGSTKDHVAAWRWLKRELAEFQPDLIWTSLTRASLMGHLVARHLGVPTVHWQHSAKLKYGNSFLLRICRSSAVLWVADSPSVAEFAAKTLGVQEQLECWPIFRANPLSPEARRWHSGEPVQIGTLGRLHAVKGYDVLCEAIRLLKDHPDLPPFQVTIAGDGPERSHLEHLIAKDNLPIRLLGHCTEPMDFLKTLHLYVQPSHWEGMCVAAHEAMSCALPVITTPAGELPSSVLDGETGKIVPFNNAPALAAAIASMISNPEHLAVMGASSRERVLERFGPDAFFGRGSAIMDRIKAALPGPASQRR